MEKEKKWQELARKISQGHSLSDAAEQLGIPEEDAIKHASEQIQHVESLGFEMRQVAYGCLKESLAILKAVANEGPRNIESSNCDVDAAKALARLAMDAIKMSKTIGNDPKAGEGAKKDLWDLLGSWRLKTPGAD